MYIKKNNPKAGLVEAVVISDENKSIIQQLISGIKKITVFEFNKQLCSPRSISSDVNLILRYKNYWLVVVDKSSKQFLIISSAGFDALYEPYQNVTSIELNEEVKSNDVINEPTIISSKVLNAVASEEPKVVSPKPRRTRTRKVISNNSSTEESIDIQ